MTDRTILLVEDNETHAHLVTRHLRKAKDFDVSIIHAQDLSQAIEQLESTEFDAMLLDLSLPDSPIHETLERMVSRFPSVPVIVLTSLDDLDFATKAVQQGAQDYLVKTNLDAEILDRAIRYAIERKKSQQQLQQYASDLEASNKHLESFAHTLAHEIRSPLTIISGCLQIIQGSYSEQLKDDIRQLLTDSLTAIGGMTELVECLLEFSQANSRDDAFGPVDLEAVLFHVSTILQPAIQEARAELTHDAMPDISGNEVQLRQLLQNLIQNSIKYRRDEKLVVHVSCIENADNWTLSVQDNGCGIAVEDQVKIFNAFTRLDGTSHISGVGIGLAFCKRIVDNHRGRLWVESEPGVGSKFLVELPKSE